MTRLRRVLGFVLWLLLRVYVLSRAAHRTNRGRVWPLTPRWYLLHVTAADPRPLHCAGSDQRTLLLRGEYTLRTYDPRDDWAWTRPDKRAPRVLESVNVDAYTYMKVTRVGHGGAWLLVRVGDERNPRGWHFRENA